MSRRKESAPFSLFAFQDVITSVCGVVVLVTLILALELTRRVVDDSPTPPTSNATEARETREQIERLRVKLASIESSVTTTDPVDATPNVSLDEARSKLTSAKTLLEAAKEERRTLREERVRAEKLESSFSAREAKIEELKRLQSASKEELRAATSSSDETPDERRILYETAKETRETPWYVDISGGRVVVWSTSTAEERKEFLSAVDFLTWAQERPRAKEYFVLIVRPSGAEWFDLISYSLEDLGYKIGVDLIGEKRELEFLSDAPNDEEVAPEK